jgi:hypothetical protein
MRTELLSRFIYRPPLPETNRAAEAVRQVCKEAADKLDRLVPAGPEHNVALLRLEEAMFWARAGIERHPPSEAQCSTPATSNPFRDELGDLLKAIDTLREDRAKPFSYFSNAHLEFLNAHIASAKKLLEET